MTLSYAEETLLRERFEDVIDQIVPKDTHSSSCRVAVAKFRDTLENMGSRKK